MDTKALIEERLKLHEENKAALTKAQDEKRLLNADEQQEFNKKDARITELRQQIENLHKVEEEERLLGESRGRQTESVVLANGVVITERDRDLALRAWALGPKRASKITATMREAAGKLSVDLNDVEIAGYLDERSREAALEIRALSAGNTSAGGYSVPDEMMRAFVEVQKWYGRVEDNATVLNTTTGAPLPIPTVNDTSNTGEIIGEGSAVTTTADPSFGQTVLGAFKYSSKAVIVSVELLQDSSINLPQYLGRALGTRIGRIKNTHFTTGGGTSVPWGIVTRASLGTTATATNAITLDQVIDLFHSVDIAYRSRPGAAWMMHDTIAAYLRKIKDSQNHYQWEMSVQAGQPDRLFGYPVIINNDMESVLDTSNKVILFGDMEAYHVRNAGPVTFIRADELRVLNHQVVFLAFQRSDGDLPDITAVRYLVTA